MKSSPPHLSAACHAKTSGFTLVELLTAGAIFILTLTMLANVLNSVTSVSSQVSTKLDAVRLGREIFDAMGRDLTQMVTTRTCLSPRAMPDTTPAASPELARNPALQFCVNPSQIDPAFKHPSAVFWQAIVSRDQTEGNLAIVGYFVERPSHNRAQLRRVLIEPSNTALYRVYNSPSNWLPNATLVDNFTSAAAAKPDQGWLADGVLGLWVRCLDANGVVITRDGSNNLRGYDFDSRLGYRSAPGPTPGPAATGGPTDFAFSTFNARPAFVEIGLVCIAPRELDRITTDTVIPVNSSPSQSSFEEDINSYLVNFQRENPRVKTAVALTRRFRIHGGY